MYTNIKPEASVTLYYGVASIGRLLRIIGLFCKRALIKRLYSAKDIRNFKELANRSHPIPCTCMPTYSAVVYNDVSCVCGVCIYTGGGQPSDTGFVGGVKCIGVENKDGIAVHVVCAPIQEGTQVDVVVEWDRYRGCLRVYVGERERERERERHWEREREKREGGREAERQREREIERERERDR